MADVTQAEIEHLGASGSGYWMFVRRYKEAA